MKYYTYSTAAAWRSVSLTENFNPDTASRH